MQAAHRFTLTRLRLGCSDLRVVQGRRHGLARDRRICQVHVSFDAEHNQVEDIRHFLLECPAYEGIRLHPCFKDIFSCVFTNPTTDVHLTTSQMIRKIFTHHDQARLALCVHRMFQLRALILAGEVQAGHDHHDLPRPMHPLRQWWLLGSNDDLSRDTF